MNRNPVTDSASFISHFQKTYLKNILKLRFAKVPKIHQKSRIMSF